VYKKLIEVIPNTKPSLHKYFSYEEHSIDMEVYEEFGGQMKASLENVIVGINYIHPKLECCLNFNLIIAELLYILKEEDLTFWLLTGLMQKYNLESLFVKGMITLDLHTYMLRVLLEERLPKLSGYLKSLGVTWDRFTKDFVSALGSSYLPLAFTPQVFDIFFMDGWVGLYKIGMVLFEDCAAEINKMNAKEISNLMRTIRKAITSKDAQIILQRSALIQMDKDLITRSFDSFFNEEASKYLSKDFNPKDWPEDLAKTLSEAYKQVNELTKQHEIDMKFFSQKLVKIEALLLE
jgi:hypothetical protein